jgi:hypothetical protein
VVGPDNWAFHFMCSAFMTQQLVIKVLAELAPWTVLQPALDSSPDQQARFTGLQIRNIGEMAVPGRISRGKATSWGNTPSL